MSNINKELRNLYLSKIPNLKSMVKEINHNSIDDVDGPLLMKCFEQYYLKSNKKILFVGQEANGWWGEICLYSEESIDDCMNYYEGFRLGKGDNMWINKSPFWQVVHYDINARINSGMDVCFLWTNVLKFAKKKETGHPDSIISELELKYFNILKDEINIVKPDIVIFFSGPNYDEDINKRLGNVEFNTCSDFPVREMAQLKNKHLPEKSFRLYHPGYLNRNPDLKANYLDSLFRLI